MVVGAYTHIKTFAPLYLVFKMLFIIQLENSSTTDNQGAKENANWSVWTTHGVRLVFLKVLVVLIIRVWAYFAGLFLFSFFSCH